MITSGFGCKGLSCNTTSESQRASLTYWGVWDSPGQLQALISAYEASHPTVQVDYKQLRYEEYERKLLEAWADDRGPDIFAIPASWINT